jgi:hypothetical protein
MKLLILVGLLITGIKCVAQNTSFDKVIISYAKGHNSWAGQPEVYSNEERFEYTPTKSGDYKIVRYQKIEFLACEDGGTCARDTAEVRLNKFKVARKIFDDLYIQLTTTKLNFTPAFIRPYLIPATENDIIAISKKIDKYYKFEDDDKQELAESINRIKRFYKIDSFINIRKPDTALLYTSMTDAWDFLRLSFIKGNDTTVFDSNFYRPLGQPILKLRVNRKFMYTQFFNLEVNTLLEGMLPKSSILRKRVGINSLTEEYVEWYIDKVL